MALSFKTEFAFSLKLFETLPGSSGGGGDAYHFRISLCSNCPRSPKSRLGATFWRAPQPPLSHASLAWIPSSPWESVKGFQNSFSIRLPALWGQKLDSLGSPCLAQVLVQSRGSGQGEQTPGLLTPRPQDTSLPPSAGTFGSVLLRGEGLLTEPWWDCTPELPPPHSHSGRHLAPTNADL